MTTFRYLRQVFTAGDDDWLAVVGKLEKSRKSWGRLYWILIREGADLKVSGSFNKLVAQAVLLFGAERWVLAPRMERALDRFQHRVARQINWRQPQICGYGIWEYPPLTEAMGESGFKGIRKSVTRRQNTSAQYIAMQTIMDLCERATWRPGARVSRWWWYQAVINLEEARKREAEAEMVSELESDSELNADPVGEEELRIASGSSGAEWSVEEE